MKSNSFAHRKRSEKRIIKATRDRIPLVTPSPERYRNSTRNRDLPGEYPHGTKNLNHATRAVRHPNLCDAKGRMLTSDTISEGDCQIPRLAVTNFNSDVIPTVPILGLPVFSPGVLSSRSLRGPSSRSSSRSNSWALSETPRFSSSHRHVPGPGSYSMISPIMRGRGVTSSFSSTTLRSDRKYNAVTPGPSSYRPIFPLRKSPRAIFPSAVREVSHPHSKVSPARSPGPVYYPKSKNLSSGNTQNLSGKIGCMSFGTVAPRFKYPSRNNFPDVREKFYMYFRKPS